jgi:hypothetical protein
VRDDDEDLIRVRTGGPGEDLPNESERFGRQRRLIEDGENDATRRVGFENEDADGEGIVHTVEILERP